MNNDMTEEKSDQVMMDELQMIIRAKVNDIIAMKEKHLNETIQSLKESLMSKTDLLEQVTEAKTILESTVEHLKSVNEIKSTKIDNLRSQLNNDKLLNDGCDAKIINKTFRLKNNLIKMQQRRIESLKKQNKTLKSELDASRNDQLVQATALHNQIRMLEKTIDIFGNDNDTKEQAFNLNSKEYELLLNEKDLQIKECVKGMGKRFIMKLE